MPETESCCGVQASIGQLREAHMLFGDYIAAFSHFGWIPEQISVLLNQVAALPTSARPFVSSQCVIVCLAESSDAARLCNGYP